MTGASSSSMSKRADRVLQSESQRSTISSGAKKIRSILPKQIAHMWKRLFLLADAFLRFSQMKNYLITQMGEETINPREASDSEDFEKIYVNPDKSSSSSSKTNQAWRVLTIKEDQYVVGKELKQGKGEQDKKKTTHDPLICQHPSDKMLGRGGRANKWWYCQACGTRWERIPLSSYEATNDFQTGKDLVTFGRHVGMSYNTVWAKFPAYCDWVLRTVESGDDPSQQLKKFARYIASREARSPEDIPAGQMDEEL